MLAHTLAVVDPEALKTPFNRRRSAPHRFDNPDIEATDHGEVLISALEEGLSVLGKGTAQVILYNMDKQYSLKRHDILKKPERFHEFLHAIFGAGAATIEGLIIQSICTATGLDVHTLNERTLQHCLREAEKALRTSKKAWK